MPATKLVFAGVLVSVILLDYQAINGKEPSPTPNVILFMADDMGMGDTSAYQDFTGNSDDQQLHTPSMDRLARMGVRFTDAHTPGSRCTATRYGLLTGRYPWRTRLKHFVLFGSQGDPLIEADRPTLATLFQDHGYGTAITGKWHVGLLYRQANAAIADDWGDADLSQPLADCPLDHGFEFSRITSRSHGTSGPVQSNASKGGPGHLDGRISVTAMGPKSFHWKGSKAYVLDELGGRHSDDAIEYLTTHLEGEKNAQRPFFLYYPSNSNHTPYTPDDKIGNMPVQGASKTKSGKPGTKRLDFVYENDVALGRLLNWLEENDDPRNPGQKLIDTTLVIFTSDNGAEKNVKDFTGPYRSNKASCYEGGHRVPFIVAWAAGGIGDGNGSTAGQTNPSPISLVDVYATFAELLDAPLPLLSAGAKGAEDSVSMLASWRGEVTSRSTNPIFVNDHKEAGQYDQSQGSNDPAAMVMRLDDPVVDGTKYSGQWKIFFDSTLIRQGTTHPAELYNLADDSHEAVNLVARPDLQALVDELSRIAKKYRMRGGARLAELNWDKAAHFQFTSLSANGSLLEQQERGVTVRIEATEKLQLMFSDQGIGVWGNDSSQVNDGETLQITFDRDVLVEAIEIVAGKRGKCGGFFHVGDSAPLPVYCVDAHAEKYTNTDHSGILSDVGVVKAGEVLRIDSGAHYGANAPGSWTLRSLVVRPLNPQ